MRHLGWNTGADIFVLGGGLCPAPLGLELCPSPMFPQWHQVPIGLTNQYTKLNTNRAIVLVNISILVWTDTFLLFLLSPKNKLKSKLSKQFTVSTPTRWTNLHAKLGLNPTIKLLWRNFEKFRGDTAFFQSLKSREIWKLQKFSKLFAASSAS